jgi:hypothetical protein
MIIHDSTNFIPRIFQKVGRVHAVVHNYTILSIYICRENIENEMGGACGTYGLFYAKWHTNPSSKDDTAISAVS